MSWQRFFRREKWDEERKRELESYLEMETAENLEKGLSPEDARDAARVLGIYCNPDVQVIRRAAVAVMNDGISAKKQVPNPVRIQRL